MYLDFKKAFQKVVESGKNYLVSFQLSQKTSELDKISGKQLLEQTGIVLRKGEVLLYCQSADFFEERAIRTYISARSGVRIARGVWIGQSKGQSESHGEMRKIDSGVLAVTTDRLLFHGNLKSHVIPLKKINHVQPHNGEIEIGSDTRQKLLVFSSKKPQQLAYKIKFSIDPEENDAVTQTVVLRELLAKVPVYIQLVLFNGTFNNNNLQKYAEIVKRASECLARDVDDYAIGNIVNNKTYQKVKAISDQLILFSEKCQKAAQLSSGGEQIEAVKKLTDEFAKVNAKILELGVD